MACKRKMTIGLLVGNRGFFPDHLAVNFSFVAPAVHEATTRYLGWDMYAHSA